jgi:hypothetical protein
MRAREAIRLFFEAWDKKFQAAGCKAILTAEIHGTGSFGRRSRILAGWLWSKRKRPGTGMIQGLVYEPT